MHHSAVLQLLLKNLAMQYCYAQKLQKFSFELEFCMEAGAVNAADWDRISN